MKLTLIGSEKLNFFRPPYNINLVTSDILSSYAWPAADGGGDIQLSKRFLYLYGMIVPVI